MPNPSAPLEVADWLVQRRWTHDTGCPILRRHRGGWYGWQTTHWEEVSEEDVRKVVYRMLRKTKYQHRDDKGDVSMRPFAPDKVKVSKILDALPAVIGVSAAIDTPSWVDVTNADGAADPTDVVAVGNGLLHLPTRQLLHGHWPCYFNTYALQFDFDPAATCPKWEETLREVFPDDQASIDCLQDWAGYVISGSTSLQKGLIVKGPSRSFKGVFSDVLTALVGEDNVAGPTSKQLAGDFGLWPLIGKPLAVVPDARFDGGRETRVFIERALSIIGGGRLDINRKQQSFWSGRLPTRFMVLTNETPILPDSSATVVGRWIVVETSISFYGREDVDLLDKLLAELPGIFNWALKGWERVRETGRITQPQGGSEVIDEMRRLASPVRAFVEDCCVLQGDIAIQTDAMYQAFDAWCTGQGIRNVPDQAAFGRDLNAACSNLGAPIRTRRPRTADGGRSREYVGVGLRNPMREPSF